MRSAAAPVRRFLWGARPVCEGRSAERGLAACWPVLAALALGCSGSVTLSPTQDSGIDGASSDATGGVDGGGSGSEGSSASGSGSGSGGAGSGSSGANESGVGSSSGSDILDGSVVVGDSAVHYDAAPPGLA